jgi:hypothetical protein
MSHPTGMQSQPDARDGNEAAVAVDLRLQRPPGAFGPVSGRCRQHRRYHAIVLTGRLNWYLLFRCRLGPHEGKQCDCGGP